MSAHMQSGINNSNLFFHSPSLPVCLSVMYLLTYEDKVSCFSYSGWPVSPRDLPASVFFPSLTTGVTGFAATPLSSL